MSPHQAMLGAGAREVPPDEVGGTEGFLALGGGPLPCLRVASLQVSGSHEAPDPVEPAADAFGGQAGPDASYTGVAVAGGVYPADPGGEVDVGQVAVADRPGPPGVVPGAGHVQFGAHEVDGVLVVLGPVRDRSEDHCWPFANQAATFFANSASISTFALSRSGIPDY